MDPCSICLESHNNKSIQLSCGHIYHKRCIDEWSKIRPLCPMCRKIVLSRFKIFTYTCYFAKSKILDINNNEIIIRDIKTRKKIMKHIETKIIINPTFINKNLLAQNEYISADSNIIKINTIKKIMYFKRIKYAYILIYYMINNKLKSYYFYCKNDKITLLFDIIKYLLITR